MRKLTYILCLIFALTSCEMTFELNMTQEKSKIFAFCVPGARDSTAIIVHLARRTGDKLEFDNSQLNINLTVNGVAQDILFQPEYTYPLFSPHSIPEKCFYVTHAFQSGDEVELNVSYPGLDPVSSRTVIPSKPVDPTFTIEKKTDGRARFILEYTDHSEESFYAVVFRQKEHYILSEGWIEESGEVIQYISEHIQWSTIFSGHEYDPFQSMNEFNFQMYNNNDGLYFWKNSNALDKNGKKSVFFELYTQNDFSQQWNDLNYSHFDYSYEATIYRINEDLFKYYYTDLQWRSNSLAYLGMSRNTVTFSNINNGCGILGGMAGHTMMYDTTISDKENYLPEVY